MITKDGVAAGKACARTMYLVRLEVVFSYSAPEKGRIVADLNRPSKVSNDELIKLSGGVHLTAPHQPHVLKRDSAP